MKLLYQARQFCASVVCHLLSLHCGQKYGRGRGIPMLVCRAIGNVHTVASVQLVESTSWVCMLMGGHIVVCAGSVRALMLGVKSVIWCFG